VPHLDFTPGVAGARALDAADELSQFRRRFELPRERGRTLTYLCGHSLGLMPRAARRAVDAELDRWAARGVDGHSPDSPRPGSRSRHGGWLDYHVQFAAPLAALTGARRDEVVAMNTLTVNLHLLLATFFRPTAQRYKILIERDAFPSDRYAVDSQLRWHGLDPQEALVELNPRPGSLELDRERFDALLATEGERIALVLLPGVQYLSGERLDLTGYAAAARAHGCRVGFDLAHAIGNVPLALHDSDADFAVWCSYKYLNAGPGAVGGCFVHARHARVHDLPRLAGWWGHDRARRFLMEREFAPLRGAEGWQLSNPPILSLAPLAASLALFTEAGVARLRRKSERLTRYLEWLLATELGERERVLTPKDPARRGCHLAMQFDPPPRRARTFVARLRAAGVVADWREPNVLRLAPVPLYNRYHDVYTAVQALKRTLDT
jgi:kynureninase